MKFLAIAKSSVFLVVARIEFQLICSIALCVLLPVNPQKVLLLGAPEFRLSHPLFEIQGNPKP
jgi:hypothetical protein